MVMMLRQCCCGCTLKTGTIIIGVLNLIGAAYNFIGGIIVAAANEIISNEVAKETDLTSEEMENLADIIRAVMIVAIVIGAIQFIVAVCLLIGALSEKPGFLLPWIIYTCVYAVVNLILYIVAGAMYIQAGLGASGAGYLISAILALLLETYFVLVVYSLYRELKGTAPVAA